MFRYADDCNIYVKSTRAGVRVMKEITQFIENKLYQQVNKSKSKVAYCNDIKFLGFGFYYSPRHKQIRVRGHPKSVKRLKDKLKNLTSRSWSVNLEYRLFKIKQVIVGWVNYYRLADMKSLMIEMDSFLRRRIRACIWKTWKRISKRFKPLKQLIKLFKIKKTTEDAWTLANTRKGIMHTTNALKNFIKNKALAPKGLVSLLDYYNASRINLNIH